MNYKGYVGTYTSKNSEGIYSFKQIDNKIKEVGLFVKVKNPKYLTFVNNLIGAVCDFEKGSGVALFDELGNEIDRLVFEDSTSCYLDYKDGYLYTVNYHEGTFSIVKVENNRLSLVKKILIKEKAGSHQVLFYRDKFLVPCLFLNQIVIFNKDYEIEDRIYFEAGAGPRHGVFSEDNKYLYIIGELSNILYVVDMDKKEVVNKVFVLEGGKSFLKDSAAIRMKDDYLYVSTRTEDVISILKVNGKDVKLLQVVSSGGLHPRDFIVVEDGLIVANRFSDNLTLLSLKDGLVEREIDKVPLYEGVAIIVKEI